MKYSEEGINAGHLKLENPRENGRSMQLKHFPGKGEQPRITSVNHDYVSATARLGIIFRNIRRGIMFNGLNQRSGF